MMRAVLLIVFALLCLLSPPARAGGDAIAALDRLTGEFALYVSVPAMTPELAGALVRAHRRGVQMGVMVPGAAAGSPEVTELRRAGVRVHSVEPVTEAVILYDDAHMAEGPDARHLVMRVDRKASDRLAIGFIAKVLAAVGAQQRI